MSPMRERAGKEDERAGRTDTASSWSSNHLFSMLLLGWEPAKRPRGDTWRGERKGYMSRSIEGREDDFRVFIYTPILTAS